MACFAVNTPAASSAEYSPRESPAVYAGCTPFSASTAVTPQAKATMQGWVYWVCPKTPSGSSKQTRCRSKSSAALSNAARKAGDAS